MKGAIILIVFLGILGDLLAPWLIRYLAAGFAWLQLAAWGALWLGGGAMVGPEPLGVLGGASAMKAKADRGKAAIPSRFPPPPDRVRTPLPGGRHFFVDTAGEIAIMASVWPGSRRA